MYTGNKRFLFVSGLSSSREIPICCMRTSMAQTGLHMYASKLSEQHICLKLLPPRLYYSFTFIIDNTIHASGKNKPEIEHKLQSDANETEVWSINNKLPIHYGKSTTMTLGTRHEIQQAGQLNISIGNTQLNPVSSQKLLGVHIDETNTQLEPAY